jgi:hypothetical protein
VSGPAAAADPPESRQYPPTYSSRKAPWYDPFHLLNGGSDKKAPTPAPPPAAWPQSQPVPNAAVEHAPGPATAPAWKWYGYGTPTPGRNPLAPAGAYGPVPANWYTASGATPGAVPPSRAATAVPGLVPDPVPGPKVIYLGPTATGPTAFASPDAPAVGSPQADKFAEAEVDWSPAPAATLKLPTAEQVASGADASAPPAVLKAPVRADEAPVSGPALGAPVQPAAAPPAESPDIPVEPAKDIVLPPNPGPGSMSKAAGPLTARAQAPDVSLADLIRQACGPQVRVMEFSPAGPRHAVLRLAANRDAALAARDRLARVPDLAGWRIEFELVSPLRP